MATAHGLLAVPAVVGFERPLLDHLAARLSGSGRSVDRREGVLVVDGGAPGPRLSAHVDRHGLVAGPGGFRYAAHHVREVRYGEQVRVAASVAARVCGRFAGEAVFAYDPASGATLGEGTVGHVCNPDEPGVAIPVDGLDGLPAGTPVAYALGCSARRDVVSGQLDNALSAAIVVEMLGAGFGGRAYFTVEEEVGRSWEHLAAADPDPTRELLVLDTSPFEVEQPARDGMVVLRNRDANGTFDAGLVRSVAAACDRLGVPWLAKDELVDEENLRRLAAHRSPKSLGSTELGRLVAESGGSWNGATVQVPTYGYHTNHESTSVRAVEGVCRVLAELVL